MAEEKKETGRQFWLQWVLVTAVCLAVGLLASRQLTASIEDAVNAATAVIPDEASEMFNLMAITITFNLFSTLPTGLVLGIGQSLLLRGRIRRSSWWVFATMGGYSASLPVATVLRWWLIQYAALPLQSRTLESAQTRSLGELITFSLSVGVLTGVTWGLLGMAQWFVLRWQIARSVILIWTGFIAGFAAKFISTLGILILLYQWAGNSETAWLLDAGSFIEYALVGALTGVALVWTLNQERIFLVSSEIVEG